MIVDVVSGWTENVGDGSPIWDIADEIAFLQGAEGSQPLVRRHTCGTDLRPFLASSREVVESSSRRMWIVYSYGCADLWLALAAVEAWRAARMGGIDHLVGIAPVPRLGNGQLEDDSDNGVWHVPPVVKAATFFIPTEAGGRLRDPNIPQSQPIKNPSRIPPYYNIPVPGADHGSVVSIVGKQVVAIARELLATEGA